MSTKIIMPILVRLRLLDLLAKEKGRRSRLRILEKLQDSLDIDEEEAVLIGMEDVENANGTISTVFTKTKDKRSKVVVGDPMKEIEIGEIYMEVICNKLKKMEESTDGLEQHYVALYDTFESYIAAAPSEGATTLENSIKDTLDLNGVKELLGADEVEAVDKKGD